MYRAVPDLQEVDVAGDDSVSGANARRKLNPVEILKRSDISFGEPNRHLDRNCHAVVDEHKALQRLVPKLVVADRWDNERSSFGSGVQLRVHYDARYVRKGWMSL